MRKIKIKIGDNVALFNGTFGTVSNMDLATYQIEISGEHMYSTWSHILNVKTLNGEDCERNCALEL